MNHLIVGFSGYAGSGKDFCGCRLNREAINKGIHSKTYALASPIKLHCNAMFGWDERHSNGSLKEVVDPFWGFSPRHAYQTFGTEWARTHLRKDIWLKFMERQFSIHKQEAEALGKDSLFIVTDVRFQNELDKIKDMDGLCISVVNKDTETDIMPHASEAQIKDLRKSAYYIIQNNHKEDPEIAAEFLMHSIDIVLNKIKG